MLRAEKCCKHALDTRITESSFDQEKGPEAAQELQPPFCTGTKRHGHRGQKGGKSGHVEGATVEKRSTTGSSIVGLSFAKYIPNALRKCRV
jgi:hypothetical protein